jgi:methylenetetrahydrofolate--tRNA-(uracil-5-)-methyltransferase
MTEPITIIGGGLAGYEMRPQQPTEAHITDRLAELVCSNSMGSTLPDRALGILKNELLRMGSLIIQTAFRHALPAGSALAVSREDFAEAVTDRAVDQPGLDRAYSKADRPEISLLLRCDGAHRHGGKHRYDNCLSPEPL